MAEDFRRREDLVPQRFPNKTSFACTVGEEGYIRLPEHFPVKEADHDAVEVGGYEGGCHDVIRKWVLHVGFGIKPCCLYVS